MDAHDVARAVGTALVVGVIGPLFWLGVGSVSLRLEGLLRYAIRRWGSKKPGAQDRLLKQLARFRVIRQ